MATKLLEVPDIRQKEGYDCGLAVLDAVLSYHGYSAFGSSAGFASMTDGMPPDLIELAMRQAGLPVLSGQMDIPLLKYLTGPAVQRPVICPVSDFGGHWIVVVGVSSHSVHAHCPLRGVYRYRKNEFLTRWHDVTRRAHTYDSWGIA